VPLASKWLPRSVVATTQLTGSMPTGGGGTGTGTWRSSGGVPRSKVFVGRAGYACRGWPADLLACFDWLAPCGRLSGLLLRGRYCGFATGVIGAFEWLTTTG
jgi:hypothetical protein